MRARWRPEDVRIDRICPCPGNRCALRAVHLPTGTRRSTRNLDDAHLESARRRLVEDLRLLVSTEVVETPVIDLPWLNMAPVSVGPARAHCPPPESYVLVALDGRPVLRIDVHADTSPVSSPFADAIRWGPWIAIGREDRVDLVEIETRAVRWLLMESYFGSFHPTLDDLFIASGQRVHRISRRGDVVWTSPEIGIDGVVIRSAVGEVVEGEGEWDPPGDWRPFFLDLETGALLA